MSEAKHTPGPWTTDETDHDAPYQNIKIQASNRTICTVWIDDAPVRDFNAEQQANSRLIAAAPELLAALKQIGAIKFSNWSDGEMRAIARAAIAKAESNITT